MSAYASLAFSCLLLAGCRPTDAAPTGDPEPPPARRFERDMMIRFHMHASFDTARAIERLLVRGKLDAARELARSLGREPDAPGLAPWTRQIALVRDRAQAVAAADNVNDALRREARLAEACASCHVDSGAQPEFRSPPNVPADQPTISARMARHRWAADRLWEGMIGDADEAWRGGLDVLAVTPLPASQLGSERTGLARQLERLADKARHRGQDDIHTRGTSYGEILMTCASCHAIQPAASQ